MSEASRVVTIEIQGLRYPIRSELDEQYVVELARYVDGKMARAGHEVPTGESLKIAVLAALNIADELFRCRGAGHDRARRAGPPDARSRAPRHRGHRSPARLSLPAAVETAARSIARTDRPCRFMIQGLRSDP